MNDPHDNFDELESQLSGLSPARPTPDLKRRIGAGIDAQPVAPRASRLRLWPLAAAACIGLAAVLFSFVSPSPPDPKPPTVDLFADAKPTSLGAYRRALADSPESMDELLDRDSRSVLPYTRPINLASLN